MAIELSLVMPVYNEEECIGQVVSAWRDTLAALGIDYRMIILNDGSKDGTAAALAAFAGETRIEIINKPNSGHGPTILKGYRKAVEDAEWVFQCDSDDEMSPEFFHLLWEMRAGYDALFGVRTGRSQNAARALISSVSRLTVRLLFGPGVVDVNTPYRLMTAGMLKEIIGGIPNDTFAPNVIISGAFARAKARILNVPVPHRGRRTGSVSIVKWRLWRAAIVSFLQTLRCRPAVAAPRGEAVAGARPSGRGDDR